MKDVHTEHCCIDHGCKYGDEDCTVTTGKAPQSYPCESCDMDMTSYERCEESWANSWDKSAAALLKSSEDWVTRGDLLQAAKCKIISETYAQVAREMRSPRIRRIERIKGFGND